MTFYQKNLTNCKKYNQVAKIGKGILKLKIELCQIDGNVSVCRNYILSKVNFGLKLFFENELPTKTNGIMYFVVQHYVRGTFKVPRTLITNEL